MRFRRIPDKWNRIISKTPHFSQRFQIDWFCCRFRVRTEGVTAPKTMKSRTCKRCLLARESLNDVWLLDFRGFDSKISRKFASESTYADSDVDKRNKV